jgi:ketol-acid reductoisomerase
MLKIFGDKDGDLAFLKEKRVAVLGYGSQGSAQAFMLRKSGVNVIVGVRRNGTSWKKAQNDGHRVMTIAAAAKHADIIHMLLPDELQGEIYAHEVEPFLSAGKTLSFSHGFAITFGLIKPPKKVDVIMVAPIAPGSEEKKLYLENQGVPAYVAVHQNPSGHAKKTALALAKAMKFTKSGVMQVSFKQETFTDLFGEQAVVCGGLAQLIETGFEVLTEAGYPAEMAYFECLHQVELVARLVREGGLGGMWKEVSNTAEYGGRRLAPQFTLKEVMKKALSRIESGQFARELAQENKKGMPFLKKARKQDKFLEIEKVGDRLRKGMNN